MKNSFIKIALVVALMLITGSFYTKAASVSLVATNGTTLAGNTGNPIVTTNSGLITTYTIANTNGVTAAFVKFYDSPNTTITNLIGAYTNRTSYITNLVVNYTNIAGAAESNTNSVQVDLQNITAAALTERRVIWATTIAPLSTVIYTPQYAHMFGLGLMCTNGLPLNITVEYLPLR